MKDLRGSGLGETFFALRLFSNVVDSLNNDACVPYKVPHVGRSMSAIWRGLFL